MAFEKADGSDRLIFTVDDCIRYFVESVSSNRLIGIEYETIPYFNNMEPAFYNDRSGVASFLEALVDQGYTPIFEDGALMGAGKDHGLFTLEPGCQVEFSSSPHLDIDTLSEEIRTHFKRANGACKKLDMALLGVGFRPFDSTDRVAVAPRDRYRVILPYLGERGRMAMHQLSTASVQVSLDYCDQVDAAEILRVGAALQPVITALCANSEVVSGRSSGWKSYRTYACSELDRSRSGLPAFYFDPIFPHDAFRIYSEWLLSIPMMFVYRDNRYHAVSGLTFGNFLAEGYLDWQATEQDWQLHIGSVFPDVRLKRVIETRMADSCSVDVTLAVAAFWKGLLYDRDARDAAWQEVADYSLSARKEFLISAARSGLDAVTPDGRPIATLAKRLLSYARDGLTALSTSAVGENDKSFLVPLEEVLCRPDSKLSAVKDMNHRMLFESLRVA